MKVNKVNAQRADAAYNLVVPYDAKPSVVQDAYERRVMQHYNFSGADQESYLCGFDRLYDDKTRMSYPTNCQWLANLKLSATPKSHKAYKNFKTILQVQHREEQDIVAKKILSMYISEFSKLYRKYNALHATLVYELTGLGGMMIYNSVQPNPNMIVSLSVYGSMIAVGIAMGLLMDSVEKSKTNIEAIKTIWHIMKSR